MHPDDDQLADHRIVAEQSFFQRATYWLWNPWYAKILWAISGLYWLGLYAMMLEPDWLSNSLAGAMILLVFLFNPITVIMLVRLRRFITNWQRERSSPCRGRAML